jgi:hypothetical protein
MVGIVADGVGGSRADWGIARMLCTKRVMWGRFAHKGCDAWGCWVNAKGSKRGLNAEDGEKREELRTCRRLRRLYGTRRVLIKIH